MASVSRQFIGCSATLPLTVAEVNDPTNVANSTNAGNAEFVKNLSKSADFGPANPRNPNSPNYGAFPGGPVYNTYLY